MVRLTAILGLALLAVTLAMSQQSHRTTQTVKFAVQRGDVLKIPDGILSKAPANSPMKVTVSFDATSKVSQALKRGTHVDASVVRSEELEAAFRKKSFLVTITD